MAAQLPKASSSRQPQNVPLPDSPKKSAKPKKNKKGKGREDALHASRAGEDTAFRIQGIGPSGSAQADSSLKDESPWTWAPLADSSPSKHPAVFTKDGRYFFSVCGSSVKIYATATGQVVSTLSATSDGGSGSRSSDGHGHTDLITAVVLSPHNHFQLITGSLDGFLKIWDYLDAVLLQTLDIGSPITHVCVHENFVDVVFLAAKSYTKPKGKNGESTNDNSVVLKVSLRPKTATAQSTIQIPAESSRVGKMKKPLTGLALSPSGAWLVATAGTKAHVAATASIKSGFTKFVSPDNLTCLAFHPTDEYFATGDEKGQIRLWYCLHGHISFDKIDVEKRAQTTTLHWHAHAVSSIAFTRNGAYLLSGGEESVLVIWQLHTGKKEFVPRVGSPIMSVSVLSGSDREEEYLLGLADSSLVFVAAGTLKISRSYSRLKIDPAISYRRPFFPTPVPLAVHPLSSALVLPSSHPSSLQFYIPTTSTLLLELEVSPSNRISRQDEKLIEPARVERATICGSGEWMATVDSREGDVDFSAEVYLKIWLWDRNADTWILNTRVDRPHGVRRIMSISFSPRADTRTPTLLVTTGADGNVKTWGIRTLKSKNGQTEEFWVNRSTFGYRGQTPSHASWSPDGSLLAVSFGPHTALYDPITNSLRRSLSAPGTNSSVSAHFIGRSGRYFAVVGHGDLVLWDLVTLTVQWQYTSQIPISYLITHPQEDSFGLLQHDQLASGPCSRMSFFRPTSDCPYRTRTLPFNFISVCWLQSSTSLYSLVGITHMWSVVLFGDDVRLPGTGGSVSSQILGGTSAEPRRTLFQDIFGKSAFADLSNQPSVSSAPIENVRPWSSTEAMGIFDKPAYLMPPIETVFIDLMAGFLTIKPPEPDVQTGSVEAVDEDVDMDIETSTSTSAKSRLERIVDEREIEIFTELFKCHAIKAPQLNGTQPHIHVNGNGVHKVNGTHRPPASSSPDEANGVIANSTIPLDSSGSSPTFRPSSPPPKIGKKRKVPVD